MSERDVIVDSVRRHIASYEPGTLGGSELNLALALRDLDGSKWDEWCEPGELEYEDETNNRFEWLGAIAFIAGATMLFSSTWQMFAAASATALGCCALYLHHRK